VLGLTVISFPFLYASLELPKIIINDAIGAENFPRTVFGIPFEQIQFLLAACGVFLALVLINGAFKFVLNVYRGQLGERMLRRLRFVLFTRVLRFPLPHFRRTSQGEIIAMVTVETEPLGGFIDDSLALPLFQGGQLLTILIFMFVQDWILGLAAIALYPLQMYLIPRLQAQVNALAKQRVRTVRELSQRIGETVAGMEDVRANDTAELERAAFSRQTGRIYEIRYRIFRKKFFIKFLNNFIAQLTPFFFSIGGYLVIVGDLTFGALVAVLNAYKDLSAPWKELLRWYQQKEDARVKYDQLIEQFEPPGMLEELPPPAADEPVPSLAGEVTLANVSLEEEGIRIVQGVSLSFPIGAKVALVGPAGGGRSGVARLLAGLLQPTAGSIDIDGRNLHDLGAAAMGRRIAYVGSAAQLFSGSIRDNLLYGLKHRPMRVTDESAERMQEHEHYLNEARASGSSESDPEADWLDLDAAGVADAAALSARVVQVLSEVDLARAVVQLGLRGAIDPADHPHMAERILAARAEMRARLAVPEYRDLVEPFKRNLYNKNMSVGENLLFGMPVGQEFDLDVLGQHEAVLSVLDQVGLKRVFLAIGLRVASTMVDLFSDLPPGHEFFERYSFISAEALPEYQAVIRRVEAGGLDTVQPEDRRMLMSLPFRLVVARHRLGLIDEEIQAKLLEARRLLAERLAEAHDGAVALFAEDAYNPVASVQDNILFGKLNYDRPRSRDQVGGLLDEVVEAQGLQPTLIEIGLDQQVGVGGSRLSAPQRQKLAIARGLIKNPDLLILDQATAALDPETESAMMEAVLAERADTGVVWVLNRADETRRFDMVATMDGGRVVELTHNQPPAAREAPQAGGAVAS